MRLQPSALLSGGARRTTTLLSAPLSITDTQVPCAPLGVLSAWAVAAFCGQARSGSSNSSFATQAHMEAEIAKQPEAAQPSVEPETSSDDCIPPSSSSSTAAPDVAEDVFHFVPLAQRRQKPLPTTDSVFLWARSEEQARLKQLIKIRAGKGGMTRKFLATCGDLLAAHEIVRVSELGAHIVGAI